MITYVALNLQKKKFQVGSTVDFKNRQAAHLRSEKNYPFYNDLRNSPSDFFWFVSEDDGLDTREEEQFYLDFYFGSEWCYNLNPSTFLGPGVKQHKESSKEKISEARKRQTPPTLGKKMSPETKEKIREALTGRKFSDELRAKLSEAKQGEKNNRFGKKHSEETKRKISESMKARKKND
jgi:group I intron endonuclease